MQNSIWKQYVGEGRVLGRVSISYCVHCMVKSSSDITQDVFNMCWKYKAIEFGAMNKIKLIGIMDRISMERFLGIDGSPVNYIGRSLE